VALSTAKSEDEGRFAELLDESYELYERTDGSGAGTGGATFLGEGSTSAKGVTASRLRVLRRLCRQKK